MAKRKIPEIECFTQQQLHDLIDYNSETGAFCWKFRPATHCRIKTWNTRFGGKPTGYITNIGYIQITINNIRHSGHRLAWFYVYGYWPPDAIDHINGIRDDNRIENLRLATWSENARNRKIISHHPLGFKGVFLSIQGNYRAYISKIRHQGKNIHLGSFKTAEEGHAAYCEAAKKFYGDFARES